MRPEVDERSLLDIMAEKQPKPERRALRRDQIIARKRIEKQREALKRGLEDKSI